jgi:protein O-GlcNAc transferase
VPALHPHARTIYGHFTSGVLHQREGRHAEAAVYYRRALEIDPRHVPSLHNLGSALKELGDLTGAVRMFRRAVQLDAGSAESWLNLGVALGLAGDRPGAEEALRQAVRRQPGNRQAWGALAHLLKADGQVEEAIEAARLAASGERPSSDSLLTLVRFLLEAGRTEQAESELQRNEDLYGQGPDLLILRARILECRKHVNEAIFLLEQVPSDTVSAIEARFHWARLMLKTPKHLEGLALLESFSRIWPQHAEAHGLLGSELLKSGRPAEALPHLEWQLARTPTPQLQIVYATALPVIPESVADIFFWRQRMDAHLDRCFEMDFVRRQALPETFATTNFYLAYHDLPDLALQQKTVELYRRACPSLNWVAPHCRNSEVRPAGKRIRVVFVSEFLRHHTIGKLNRGFIANLDRRRFEVVDVFLGDPTDASARAIGETADQYLPIGRLPLARIRERVAELRADVVLYTDIGMGGLSYRLAFSRLAPVQCVTWGHPDTTGIPTLDYFLSSEDLEPAGAERDYTETLVRMRRVNSYYYPPELPAEAISRQRLGIGDDWHVYAIPQSLFKLHPDYDAVLGAILRRDPRGHVVMIADAKGTLLGRLQERLQKAIPDVANRIHFTPRLNLLGFLGLASIADVVLDVPQFSGGNTTYESFAVGAPIVTRPSRFMRGRLTAALYRAMGLGELVCADDADYVDTAVRLGCDPGERQIWRNRIFEARPALYRDAEALRELEAFLESAMERGA